MHTTIGVLLQKQPSGYYYNTGDPEAEIHDISLISPREATYVEAELARLMAPHYLHTTTTTYEPVSQTARVCDFAFDYWAPCDHFDQWVKQEHPSAKVVERTFVGDDEEDDGYPVLSGSELPDLEFEFDVIITPTGAYYDIPDHEDEIRAMYRQIYSDASFVFGECLLVACAVHYAA